MRLPAKHLLTGAALLVSASCVGDATVAPKGAPAIGGSPALLALAVAQSVDLVVPAAGGHLNIFDVYALDFPAGAVCDPSATDTQVGYANAQWDAACTPATGDVQIRATVKYFLDGTLSVDFQPALRFVPNKHVTLSTKAFASAVQYRDDIGLMRGWSISYSPALEGPAIDDALQDPSLQTRIHGQSGTISRRIKHFSGYRITTGEDAGMPCDPNAGNPLCVWVDDDGFGH